VTARKKQRVSGKRVRINRARLGLTPTVKGSGPVQRSRVGRRIRAPSRYAVEDEDAMLASMMANWADGVEQA
jgi:hypothetical protein